MYILYYISTDKDEEKKIPDNIKLLELPEPLNEDSSSTQNSTRSTSPPLPKLLQAPSSQPFIVPVLEEPSSEKDGNNRVVEKDVLNMHESVDDSVWDDEINIGICDISGMNIVSDESMCTLGKKSDCSVNNVNKLEPKVVSVDIHSESSDVFDDDLFNESVIRSTQAVEEALVEVNELKDPIKSGGIGGCVKNITVAENNIMPHTSAKISEFIYLHDKTTKEPSTSCKRDCDLKDGTVSHERGSSPILGKSHTSSNRHIRQGRNSFRLGLHDPCQHKENRPSIQSCQETNHDRFVKNTEYSMKSNLKITPVVPKQQVQSSCAHTQSLKSIAEVSPKPSYSSFIGNKRNSPASQSIGTGSCSKAVTRKGPILRSQSADDIKNTHTVNSAGRSNSFVGIDSTQEFEEDDEIFKSLLSVLPEDDALLEGQIFQPQVFTAGHRSADVVQNAKHLESSTLITENPRTHQTVESEKKVTGTFPIAQWGGAGKTARKSLTPEYTGVMGKRFQNKESENSKVSSTWISHTESSKE